MSAAPHTCNSPGCEICNDCGSAIWPDPMGGNIHMPETICEASKVREFPKKGC